MAKGEYIAFLDSDDEWLPSKLEIQKTIFDRSNNENVVVVTCGYIKTGGRANISWTPNKRGNVLKDFVFGKIKDFQPQCWLIKSSVIHENGIRFNTKMHSGEDWDFMVEILKQGELDYTPETLVKIYQSGDDHLWSFEKHLEALTIQINKYKNDPSFSPSMVAHLYISKASRCMYLNKTDEAKQSINLAWKNSMSYKTFLWAIISVMLSWNLNNSRFFNKILQLARRASF